MRNYEINANLRAKITIPILLFLIFLDQSVKYGIRTGGGFYICNSDLAFGVRPIYFAALVLIITAILIIIAVGNYKSETRNTKQYRNLNEQKSKQWFEKFRFDISNLRFRIWPVIFIISGAISNIIDRINHGCVVDFIDLKFWPVFNLADVYITIGAFFVIMKVLSEKEVKP